MKRKTTLWRGQSSRFLTWETVETAIVVVALMTLFAWFLTASRSAHAQQAVTCVNCSTIFQQLKDAATSLQSLQQQIETATNTLNFYQRLVTNTVNLPQDIFRDISGEVQNIESLGRQSSMIQGSIAGMLSNLGAATYPIQNLDAKLTVEGNALATAMRSAGVSLDASGQAAQSQSAQLAALEAQSSQATLLQAIQTGNQIGATSGQLVATQQAALGNSMQALLIKETAEADRRAAEATVDRAQIDAGIKADCSAAMSTGTGVTLSLCEN